MARMNRVQRSALVFYRDKIVDSLDVKYIDDRLIANDVVSYDELDLIALEKSRADKVRKLLDILSTKDSDTYLNFVKALQEDYDWIAEYLLKAGNADIPDAGHLTPEELSQADHLAALLQDCLIAGGVPYPPSHLIPRNGKVHEIQTLLRESRRGEFVIIHGMAGIGKSVLAAEAVRTASVALDLCQGKVFWVTLGQVDKDVLLAKMQALCECLESSNFPPLCVDQAVERIRKLVNEDKRRNCLIVLDDVWRGEVLRCFDVGCRVLVTTREVSIAEAFAGRTKLYKMKEGFTQEESITYLSNCTHISVDNLPDQAFQIYEESKGSPMVLSLMGPVLADRREGDVDPGRWNHYLSKLKDRRYTKMSRQISYNYQTVKEAIQISVDYLDEEHANKFFDLVIFLDDVNIPAEVLETLWGVTRYDVEDVMKVFVDKSLVAHHVTTLSVVLYGIHDLLLDYLKQRVPEEQQMEIHRKLIDAYLLKCHGNYGNLPNDNYIFWYLGYHLHKAGYVELFPRIYLDLHFIAAKLRVTGPSDLLNDYKKYAGSIAPTEESEKGMEDFARFIRVYGHVIVQYGFQDIIQLALEQPRSSAVYRAARKAAELNPDKFYVEWCNQDAAEKGEQALCSTVLCRGHVTAACYAKTTSRILSAIGDGQIRMWDVDSGKELHHFTGHSGTVNHLSLSWDGTRFVSASSDGTCKVWDLEGVLGKLDEQRQSRTPSPRMRQDSWHNMFEVNGRVSEDASLATFRGHVGEVLWAEFTPNGALIVSCGTDKTAKVWMSTVGMLLYCLPHDDVVHTCCYSPSAEYIATGCGDSTIRLWNASAESCLAIFHENQSRVIFTAFLTDLSMVSVSDTQILLWEWSNPRGADTVSNPASPLVSIREIGMNKSCCYQCAALSEDGKLLAVANTHDKVVLFNTEDGSQVTEYVGHTALITSLHFKGQFLVSASRDENCMSWKVTQKMERNPHYSCQAFNALWSGNIRENLLVAAAINDKKIQLICGLEATVFHTADTEHDDVPERCVVSHNGSMVAFVTQTGLVQLIFIKNKSQCAIGTHPYQSPSLLQFSPSDTVLLSGSTDGTITLWKLSGNPLHIPGPSKGVVAAYFLHEETQLLLCGADGSLRIWRVDNGRLSTTLADDNGLHVICVDLSESRSFIAQGTSTQGVHLTKIDPDKMKMLKQTVRLGQQHGCPVRCCRFAKDKQILAAGYDNGSIEIWNYEDYHLEMTLQSHKSWVRDLQFVPGSSYFQLVSVGDCIIWWDLNKKQNSRSRLTAWMPPTPVTPSIRFYNASLVFPVACTDSLVQSFQFHGRSASKLHVSSDGEALVTVTDAGTLYVLRHFIPQRRLTLATLV